MDNDRFSSGPRQMFSPENEGDWKCAKCGKEIKQLPFQPRAGSANNLKCLDCFRSEKNTFGGR